MEYPAHNAKAASKLSVSWITFVIHIIANLTDFNLALWLGRPAPTSQAGLTRTHPLRSSMGLVSLCLHTLYFSYKLVSLFKGVFPAIFYSSKISVNFQILEPKMRCRDVAMQIAFVSVCVCVCVYVYVYV